MRYVESYCTAGKTTWRMRVSYSVRKATHINLEYVILIAFPPQRWLHERATLLRHMYVASLLFPT